MVSRMRQGRSERARILPRLCCPCMTVVATSRWRTPWVRQTRRTAGLAVPPAQMDTEYHECSAERSRIADQPGSHRAWLIRDAWPDSRQQNAPARRDATAQG